MRSAERRKVNNALEMKCLMKSPPLTIGRTVLKGSDELVILGGTFDSKMTFGKHLLMVSRAVSQRLGILRKSWRMFHDRSLLGRCFRSFVLPGLEYWLQCDARLPTNTLSYWTVQSVGRVPTGGVFEFDIAHRRSVAVLCMLHMIRCNPMHPLNDALPGPYVPVRVTHGALVTHRYNYAPPRCRTSQCCKTFVLLSVSLWNDLLDPLFDGDPVSTRDACLRPKSKNTTVFHTEPKPRSGH